MMIVFNQNDPVGKMGELLGKLFAFMADEVIRAVERRRKKSSEMRYGDLAFIEEKKLKKSISFW